MIPLIDTHLHLWDLSRLRLPWLDGQPRLNRSHLLADYLREARGLGVERTLYMEVDVDPAQHVLEAESVLALCRQADTPVVGAVIGGRPDSPDFEAYLDRFAGSPHLKGVRQVLHGGTPAGWCLRPDFVRGIRALGRRRLRFDLCLRPAEIRDGALLADQCPDVLFVLDHCGNADVRARDRSGWERGMAEAARRPNVVCKVSGIVASARPGQWTPGDLEPIIARTVELFGIDRVMFGSDWPVCTLAATLREWVGALHEVITGWSDEEKRKLLHDNALRHYDLVD